MNKQIAFHWKPVTLQCYPLKRSLDYTVITFCLFDAVEPAGEVSGERDASGVRSSHDPVQSAQTAGEPGPAEI